MKILYLSTPSFADCDFPLIKEFIRQGHDITYLITLTPYSLKSTLFNIESNYHAMISYLPQNTKNYIFILNT